MPDSPPIIIRRGERRRLRNPGRDAWDTFPGLADGFGALAGLVDIRLPPGTRATLRPQRGGEVITYVFTGAMTDDDGAGHPGLLLAGEFQVRAAARGDRHGEGNASRTEWAHAFQIRLHAHGPRRQPGSEQRRFPTAERRGGLCVVASPDGRRGSLRLGQDVVIHSAILDPGQHLAHALGPPRSIWLHVVLGELLLGGLVLGDGDGAGVTAGRAVSIIAQTDAEILLIDLGAPRPRHAPPRQLQ